MKFYRQIERKEIQYKARNAVIEKKLKTLKLKIEIELRTENEKERKKEKLTEKLV